MRGFVIMDLQRLFPTIPNLQKETYPFKRYLMFFQNIRPLQKSNPIPISLRTAAQWLIYLDMHESPLKKGMICRDKVCSNAGVVDNFSILY